MLDLVYYNVSYMELIRLYVVEFWDVWKKSFYNDRNLPNQPLSMFKSDMRYNNQKLIYFLDVLDHIHINQKLLYWRPIELKGEMANRRTQ